GRRAVSNLKMGSIFPVIYLVREDGQGETERLADFSAAPLAGSPADYTDLFIGETENGARSSGGPASRPTSRFESALPVPLLGSSCGSSCVVKVTVAIRP